MATLEEIMQQIKAVQGQPVSSAPRGILRKDLGQTGFGSLFGKGNTATQNQRDAILQSSLSLLGSDPDAGLGQRLSTAIGGGVASLQAGREADVAKEAAARQAQLKALQQQFTNQGAATTEARLQGGQTFDQQLALAKLARSDAKTAAKPTPPSFAEKELIKTQNKRLGELRSTAPERQNNIKEAKKFLKLFKEGTMESGTTRTAAGILPGVFTKQGERDQQFDALAEKAARQALKEAGEIRPTDADVEGMKQAMFGVGKDEQVNINLLKNFINAAEQSQAEFEAGSAHTKKTGSIRGFVPPAPAVPEGEWGIVK